MKVLAVDTSTGSCSVALLDGAQLCAEITTGPGATHNRRLMILIDRLLAQVGWDLAALDGFGVVEGPGSFTGLRIGMSTVKGLAQATGKPLAGVSGLEVLARQYPQTEGLVCPMIDARRKEVYYAVYRYTQGRLTAVLDERAAAPSTVWAAVRQPCLYVGSGALLYRREIAAAASQPALVPNDDLHVIRAATAARLVLERLQSAPAQNGDRLVPNYIRQSDAELAFRRAAGTAIRGGGRAGRGSY